LGELQAAKNLLDVDREKIAITLQNNSLQIFSKKYELLTIPYIPLYSEA
jgi:hypothetical protein